MPTDKDVVAEMREQATVVFDESMRGKNIDAIDKPGVSLNFKDQGTVSAPVGRQNLISPGQRVPSKRYKKHYDEIAWACVECGEMHPKGEDCK